MVRDREWQRDRETERQRDSERQRDRETARDSEYTGGEMSVIVRESEEQGEAVV